MIVAEFLRVVKGTPPPGGTRKTGSAARGGKGENRKTGRPSAGGRSTGDRNHDPHHISARVALRQLVKEIFFISVPRNRPSLRGNPCKQIPVERCCVFPTSEEISDSILPPRHHGTIIEQGSHTELLKRGGAYAALYQSQFA